MCGIVGYTGPREAGPILIEGLRRLEYRGYDSAGIALVDEQGDLFVEKKAGKLANLQTAIADRTPHAALGLAHTRWATHGRILVRPSGTEPVLRVMVEGADASVVSELADAIAALAGERLH